MSDPAEPYETPGYDTRPIVRLRCIYKQVYVLSSCKKLWVTSESTTCHEATAQEVSGQSNNCCHPVFVKTWVQCNISFYEIYFSHFIFSSWNVICSHKRVSPSSYKSVASSCQILSTSLKGQKACSIIGCRPNPAFNSVKRNQGDQPKGFKTTPCYLN